MTARVSFDAAHLSAIALEQQAKDMRLSAKHRRMYQQTADALWALLSEGDAIELGEVHTKFETDQFLGWGEP